MTEAGRLWISTLYDLGIVFRKDKELSPVENRFLELAQAHTDKTNTL